MNPDTAWKPDALAREIINDEVIVDRPLLRFGRGIIGGIGFQEFDDVEPEETTVTGPVSVLAISATVSKPTTSRFSSTRVHRKFDPPCTSSVDASADQAPRKHRKANRSELEDALDVAASDSNDVAVSDDHPAAGADAGTLPELQPDPTPQKRNREPDPLTTEAASCAKPAKRKRLAI